MRALIVGAQPNGLGSEIAQAIPIFDKYADVVTAGVRGQEDYMLSITASGMCTEFFERLGAFDVVVCTAGINKPTDILSLELLEDLKDHWDVNALGHIRLLRAWLARNPPPNSRRFHQFVSISSNSAHIARTNSMAYCMTKAALSMAIRVMGREMGTSNRLIYAWEPGAIADTPMTEEVLARLPAGTPLSRSPGAPRGMDRVALAETIASTLCTPHAGLQGMTLRIDGGEQ
jgi:NAD(P)-dependent dehydrogenase (short-subunit alcohol dehydrogenase family)